MNINESSSNVDPDTTDGQPTTADEGETNHVGRLKELCDQKECKPPKYEKVSKSGKDHTPTFVFKCEVTINGKEYVGEGKGSKKQIAKNASAKDVIGKMKNDEVFSKTLDSSSVDKNKLIEYFSEYLSNNTELNKYLLESNESKHNKKLEKIAGTIGCLINYIESNDNRVVLRLVIPDLSNHTLITSYGSSDEGLEAAKEIAAKKAIAVLEILN